MGDFDFDPQTIDVVNALFEKMIRIKPAFKQAWPTDTEFQLAKREWIGAFQRTNIKSINRIKRGIERLTDCPKSFVPSPGEFLELCRVYPEDIGAPSVDVAYQEAIKNAYPDGTTKTWTHEVVRHAYHKSDPHFLRTNSASKTKEAFVKNYLEACSEYAEGRNLNQIEHKSKDTPENRMRYQELFGGYKRLKKSYPAYEEWLKQGA